MNDLQEQIVGAKKIIDSKLAEFMENNEPLLNVLQESVNYSLFSGGKRVRPLFCFLVGELFGVPKEKLITTACALEMIHTSSLIMDDLPHMDDGKVRRGKPANHMVFGQDVSALASIGLLTRAYEIVLNDPELPDDKKTKVVSRLARTVGINGLVGGQFVDLKFSNEETDAATLDYIHTYKTASLFASSGVTAAIIGDANDAEISALETYAKNLGFAFQILDDLLDVEGNSEDVGKSLNNDKGGFVTVYGVEKSKHLVQEYTDKALTAIEIFKGKNEKLIVLAHMLLKRKA
ncbi:MAG: polyprenyl synthetase family protein [Desulfatiglans sp.]|jgi:geranylgeranyl diphosphate synthase type II|nr:polyprenyl synthetase family protein [Desulfatiglans sp.]